MISNLVGFVRKSEKGSAVKVSISKEAFENAKTYVSQSGEEFVPLIISMGHLEQLIAGEKEVTSICQIQD